MKTREELDASWSVLIPMLDSDDFEAVLAKARELWNAGGPIGESPVARRLLAGPLQAFAALRMLRDPLHGTPHKFRYLLSTIVTILGAQRFAQKSDNNGVWTYMNGRLCERAVGLALDALPEDPQ